MGYSGLNFGRFLKVCHSDPEVSGEKFGVGGLLRWSLFLHFVQDERCNMNLPKFRYEFNFMDYGIYYANSVLFEQKICFPVFRIFFIA